MSKLFISHSSEDDRFVRDLQQVLRDLGQDGWIDSRELRGGDPLWPEIQQAIEEASGYAVVVSPNSLQSKWDRARKVEQNLVQWGQLLHQAALPGAVG